MSESMSESDSKPEMAQLEIAKGPDAELRAGGLRFVACRREVGEIDGGITLYVWSEEEPELELIRMDLFRNRPHYHAPATNDAETKIDRGDQAIEAWGVETVTRRAEQLASEAGHAELGARLSVEALKQAISIDFEIQEYGEHALGQGANAEAVTYIQIKCDGRR